MEGTVRIGADDDTRGEYSVVNAYGQVREMKNLWLGSNGAILLKLKCSCYSPSAAYTPTCFSLHRGVNVIPADGIL